MADYIDRGVLLQKAWDAGVKCGYIKAVDVEELLSLPIAEGVTQVVRCKQCAYAKWSERSKAYYCSEGCYAASYKHIGWFDGKAEERRRLKDQSRDPERERERWRRYYAAHREERIEAARQRRRENPGLAAADNAYYRRKRKLMAEGAQV